MNTTPNSIADNVFLYAVPRFTYNYFALVMATGIISLGCDIAGFYTLARALLLLNTLHFVICFIFAVAKLAIYPAMVWNDLTNSSKGPGYLTMVTGISVLGIQYSALTELTCIPLILLGAGIVMYFIVVFSLIAGIAMSDDKCSPTQGMDGLWLLCTVSGCSIVVLGMGFCNMALWYQALFFTSLWSASIMLYSIIIPLIFFRWLFSSVNRKDFSPSWWINMGALAIASLAGVKILENDSSTLFPVVTSAIVTITFFLWAAATWWLVLLLTIFVWRAVTRSFDRRYAPGNWSIIFPSGMFVVTTINIIKFLHISLPQTAVDIMVTAVFLLWLIFYFWMVSFFWSSLRTRNRMRHSGSRT